MFNFTFTLFIVNLEKIENYLETYTLEEVIEANDLSTAEVLLFLLEEEFLYLPDPEPL